MDSLSCCSSGRKARLCLLAIGFSVLLLSGWALFSFSSLRRPLPRITTPVLSRSKSFETSSSSSSSSSSSWLSLQSSLASISDMASSLQSKIQAMTNSIGSMTSKEDDGFSPASSSSSDTSSYQPSDTGNPEEEGESKLSVAAGDSKDLGSVDGLSSPKLLESEDRTFEIAKSRHLVVATFSYYIDGNSIKGVRRLIGSVHDRTPRGSSYRTLVYVLKYPRSLYREMSTYHNVELIRLEEEFVEFETEINKKYDSADAAMIQWVPTVIEHAVSKYGKVLFLNPDHFIHQNGFPVIEETLKDTGHLFLSFPKEDKMTIRAQGYVAGSKAYRELIMGANSCPKRPCLLADFPERSRDFLKSLSSIQGVFSPDESAPVGKAPQNSPLDCFVKHHTDWIFDSVSRDRVDSMVPAGKTRIALGVPTTSKGGRPSHPRDLPLFRFLVPSLINSITDEEKGKYIFEIYVGYDEDDAYWDNPSHIQDVQAHFLSILKSKGVENIIRLVMLRFRPTRGWVTYIWNGLFEKSMIDGCDFYYQINDDVTIIDSGWTTAFTEALKNSPIHPYFGITGPLDVNNGRIMTQSFVHKRHYEIFTRYFPWEFRNWFNDDWSTGVYKSVGAVLWVKSKKVRNTNADGTRYHVCHSGGNLLKNAIADGETILKRWIDEHTNSS